MLPILYLQLSAALTRTPLRFKIGITNRGLGKRSRNIADSTPGIQFPIFFCIVPAPAVFEGALHRLFSDSHAPMRRGSGRTEWFDVGLFGCNLFAALSIYALIWAIEALLIFQIYNYIK